MKRAFMACPYRSVTSDACHHRFSKKKKNSGKGVCIFMKDNTRCPLYKQWLKQIQDDEEKENKTISKEVFGL